MCSTQYSPDARDEINPVIEFFSTRWQAERMLAKVLWDEPDQAGALRIEKLEFETSPN